MATKPEDEEDATSPAVHSDLHENAGTAIAASTSPGTVPDPALASESGNGDDEVLDEQAVLRDLTSNVRDQDDLEQDITYQANLALISAEDEKDKKRIQRLEANIRKFESQKKAQEEKLRKAIGRPEVKNKLRQEIAHLDAEIELAAKDITDFHARVEQRHQSKDGGTDVVQSSNRKLPNETHREFLIRTGKITPFANIGGPRPAGIEGELANALVDAEDEAIAEDLEEAAAHGPRSHRNLRAPGFADAEDGETAPVFAQSEFSLRPRNARKKRRFQSGDSSDEYQPLVSRSISSEANFVAADEDSEDDYDLTDLPHKKPSKAIRAAQDATAQIDDGNENTYQDRLADWCHRRNVARHQHQLATDEDAEQGAGDDQPEWYKPHPTEPDHQLEYGLKLPGDIFPSLFDYQKTGVQWLAELWNQKVGGIVGDEMGLGKTVQVISFIAALHFSKQLDGPVIVVAPATVMTQWVNEFHRWWPPLRVSILHSSGSGMVNIHHEEQMEEDQVAWNDGKHRTSNRPSNSAARSLVKRVAGHGHVLVTTYAGLQTYGDILVPVQWAYAVLDEGHKIRNPNTAITIYCKELQTPNRVILSGTPMQNNLLELWSLFDFIFPMRLGTLIEFRNQFEIPIKMGGYANASNLQIMTAQKCAETLKDTISPYLLQRLKVDVAADLPAKSEQVLFCKLTKGQRDAYELFLKSDEISAIFNRTRQSLYGIDYLRKICNHPDLTDPMLRTRLGYKWGDPKKSGKLQVVKALLPMWKTHGHKTLLFSQGVQMLDILEEFVKGRGDIRYLRMDGKTAIKERQVLVDLFNNDPQIDLFLLTTKVGGLGTNLTGANRVIIFDPDWNPSTDVQARERAWRLGQKREVVIYRLMTAGTIEEKIYHRQIFKQFLSNKVLKDPKQRTTFAVHDLHDLFTLGDANDDGTQTGRLFQNSEVQLGGPSTAEQARLSTSASNRNVAPTGTEKVENKFSPAATAESITNIEGVASLETYQASADEQPAADEEARIMEGLFARGGVQQALEHEEIVNGKRKPQANRAMLQREADAVAAQAAASLRRAGERARQIPIGTVTWTGEVGEGGRPSSRPSNVRRDRGGPGSASIIANIRDRQGLSTPSTASPGSRSSSGLPRGGTPTAPTQMMMRDFERMIPDFIRRHGGQVPTKLLVDHFNQYCVTTQQSSDFKAALNRVAKMKKQGGSMRGVWGLKGSS